MPPTPQGQLKFIRDVPFRNTVHHPASDQSLPVPLTSTKRSLWTSPENMPSGIRKEIDMVLNGIYGKEVKGLSPNVYRFCWYAFVHKDEPTTPFRTNKTGMESLRITIGTSVRTLAVRICTYPQPVSRFPSHPSDKHLLKGPLWVPFM